MSLLLSENKPAIRFLLVFIVLYVVLNTGYGLFIEHYLPQADPVTGNVSRQAAFFLSLGDPSVNASIRPGSKYIPISNSGGVVLNVFEGCNGINVFIVFISYLLAFRGTLKATMLYALLGLIVIHIMNLGRIGLLYVVELHFPQYLYFFHKYIFTLLIYAAVFVLWYQWTKGVKQATVKIPLES